jgi:hypothetical protein
MITVLAPAKAWFGDCPLFGSAGSISSRNIRYQSLVSVVQCQKSLCRADHSSRGVRPNVVCLSMTVQPRQRENQSSFRGLVSIYLTVKNLSVTMAPNHLNFCCPHSRKPHYLIEYAVQNLTPQLNKQDSLTLSTAFNKFRCLS